MEFNFVYELVNVSTDYAFGLNPAIEGVRQLFPGQRVKITTGQAFKQAELLRSQYKNLLDLVQTEQGVSPTLEETPEVPAVEVPPAEDAPVVEETAGEEEPAAQEEEAVVEEDASTEEDVPGAVVDAAKETAADAPEEDAEEAPEADGNAGAPAAKKRGRRPTRRSE